MMRVIELDIYGDETPEQMDAQVIAIWNTLHPEDRVMRRENDTLVREDEEEKVTDLCPTRPVY